MMNEAEAAPSEEKGPSKKALKKAAKKEEKAAKKEEHKQAKGTSVDGGDAGANTAAGNSAEDISEGLSFS